MAALRLTARGQLDHSFGAGGEVNVVLSEPVLDTAEANAMILQPDGRLIVAGGTQDGEIGDVPSATGFDLLRFNSNGKLDKSFGDNGYVGPEPKVLPLITNTAAVDKNGQVIVAGETPFELSRLTAAGVPDTSFGFDGHVSTTIYSQNNYDTIQQVFPLPDGKVLAAGTSTLPSDSQSVPAVVRYKADGSLDTSFARNGILIPRLTRDELGSGRDFVALYLMANGKFVLAESANAGFGQTTLYFRQYNSDGSLDATFGRNGFAGGTNISLARINIDGTADQTFGTGGVASFDAGFGPAFVATDALGRIVLSGIQNVNGVYESAVARYLVNGQSDRTFGDNGLFVAAGPIAQSVNPAGLYVYSDGRIVILDGADSLQKSIVAGLTSTGQLDPSFGDSGFLELSLDEPVNGNALIPDGNNSLIIPGLFAVDRILV
jgi:uncharacterized delta-60 repeat protein